MSRNSRKRTVEAVLRGASQRWRALADDVSRVGAELRDQVGARSFSKLAPGVQPALHELEEAVGRFESAAVRPEVVIATTGTTSSGKSTLANLLIGEMLLPKAVQEMSAGVVTVRHDDAVRRLVVEATRGATWPTGRWDPSSASEVRDRLKSVMNSYRDLLGNMPPASKSEVEPPRFAITWPTRLGRRPEAFGLPASADISVVDLPGLKYVEDELNGGVVREQARRSLCVVAYNSFETDPRKQDALLRQVVDQVKALGGSPARMLFVLNRIDAFRTDSDPAASERAFCDRVTRQIRSRITQELQEYAEQASSILPIPLSSEPALYAVVASERTGPDQAHLLELLEDEYKKLFSRKDMNSLPRDPAEWSDVQRRWFIDEARTQSRGAEFEERLGAHIASRLPEIMLPPLVDGAYQPARRVLEGLDALVEAYGQQEEEQLALAIRRLETLHAQLRTLKEEVLVPLAPLREVVGGDGDLVGRLLVAVPKLENSLGLAGPDGGPGQLSALQSALTDAVQVPLQRLSEVVFRTMEGDELEEPFIDSCRTASALHRSIRELRSGPYGRIWETGGTVEGAEADSLRVSLDAFSKNMSKIATELVKRESRIQADRMRTALEAAGGAIVGRLEAGGTALVEGKGFKGLRGVYRGAFDLAPPRLPKVKFAADIEKWSCIEYHDEVREYFVMKRVWWKLWLGRSRVRKTETVTVQTTRTGIVVSKLGDLLEGFTTSGEVSDLEEFFSGWLGDSLVHFESSLEKRLRDGVKTYRLAFEERLDELKQGTKKRVEDAKRHRGAVTRALAGVDENRDWRSYG